MIDGQRRSPAAYRHAPAVGPMPALLEPPWTRVKRRWTTK